MQEKKHLLTVFLVLTALSTRASAAEFDYPELSVTPRASDRLEMEASKESQRRWINLIPFQVSALTTLSAGVLQFSNTDLSKDPAERSGWAGVAVGGGWLAATALLAMYHQPYGSAHKDVAALPRKSQREQLTRERLAEQGLQKAGSLGMKLKWLSFASNLAAGVYMATKAQSDSFSIIADGAAIGAAFAPLLFRPYWQDVADEQAEYKKRIYAPVASAGFLPEPLSGKAVPGLQLSLFF